ncbi:class D beta-lactamase [Legionella jordanis]|nr:penicillin-binding transpeptidase domain-containing protein [Legionella jordanis]RMX03910.1 class D beta-lactamase [Legionella jordanis]
MKTLISLCLSMLCLMVLAKPIDSAHYDQVFKSYHACFILYDLTEGKIINLYNPLQRCSERLAPDSTFKVALSLMAFDQKLIHQNTRFKWDGQIRELADWNQDQSPYSWLKYSTVWVSQRISSQLGMPRIKQYLANFNYGNQDFSGDPGLHNGLSHAWLSSSLKISAWEQLDFLKAMLNGKLALDSQAIENTKKNMYLGKLHNGANYFGKTGSGRHGRNERMSNPSPLRDGWFVGFIQNGKHQYIFVSNLTDKSVPAIKNNAYGSALLKPITMSLLNQYFTK